MSGKWVVEDAPAGKWVIEDGPRKQQNWSDVATSAAVNFLPSLGEMGKSIYGAVRHPINTVEGLVMASAGGAKNLLGLDLQKIAGATPQEESQSVQIADSIGGMYKDRYGSMDGFKNAVATDPAGVMADASTVLLGGSALAPKVGGIKSALSNASKFVDPVYLTAKGVQKVGSAALKVPKHVIGMTTGVGSEPFSEAYKAGKAGGDQAAMFTQNMRGAASMDDVLGMAKQNLAKMGQQKQAAYRSGMSGIKSDKSVLDMTGISQSADDAMGMVSYKGQVKNEKAAGALQRIRAEIDNWKSLDPAEYHTPEGLDALKQKIGGIVEEIPYEQKTARLAAGNVYNAVKSEITKQAPGYAKVMKEYSDATETIKEIEKALSLGNKAAADTSMRKLQSLMRNNANTSYGYRLDLAKQLEQAGRNQLMPALAGQALNDLTPRGIQRAGVGSGGAALAYMGNLPAAAALAASSSPRLMGEAAYYFGKGGGLLDAGANSASNVLGKAKIDPRILQNLLYQAGQNSGN